MINEKINRMLDILKSTQGLIIKNETLGDGMPESYYAMSKEDTGLDLKKDFNDVFAEIEFIQLFASSTENTPVSEVNIHGLMMSFNPVAQEHYIHAFEDFGEEFVHFARQFYPLDVYENAYSTQTLTIVKLSIVDSDKPELYIWNNAGHKYKLKFDSFKDYMLEGIKCQFCIGWQYFYIDTDAFDFNDSFTQEWLAPNFNQGITRMESCLELMLKYFPQDDWSYHKAELDRVKGL